MSTIYIGLAAPAHANTASGACPSCAAQTAAKAAADASEVSRENEKASKNWDGDWRRA